jgi:hypothetical protein
VFELAGTRHPARNTRAYPGLSLDLVVVDLGLQGHHFLQARASIGSAQRKSSGVASFMKRCCCEKSVSSMGQRED